MDASLQALVCEANLQLHRLGLVILTWGNVSAVDRAQDRVIIKPSGVPAEALTPECMAVVRLSTGEPLSGPLRPSSDTPTHLALYRSFPELGGIVHTHSTYATAWAQAGLDIPCYGTTHADLFHGAVPCARALTPEETRTDYELNTGRVIVETFRARHLDPLCFPGVLCRHHGPFTWGTTPQQAVEHAAALEEIARMALLSRQLSPALSPIPAHILEKHYGRKHGPSAYYGQRGGEAASSAGRR